MILFLNRGFRQTNTAWANRVRGGLSVYNLIVTNSSAVATVGQVGSQARHVLFHWEQLHSRTCVLLELAGRTRHNTIRRFLGKVAADHAAAVLKSGGQRESPV